MWASCGRTEDEVILTPSTDEGHEQETDERATMSITAPRTTDDTTHDLPDVVGHVRTALRTSAADLERALAELRPDDRRRQRALDRWFAGFATQLRRHHDLIETLVVPALAGRGALDQRALDVLAADHAWIDQLLGDLGDALGVLSFGLGDEEHWVRRSVDLAMALRHAVDGQLEREQRQLTPLVAHRFSAGECDILRHESMRRVAGGPVRFSLAWLYAHIDEAERQQVAAYAPTTRRLIWRSQRGVYERTSEAAFG